MLTHSLDRSHEVFDWFFDSCGSVTNPDSTSGCMLVLLNKAHFSGWIYDLHSLAPGRILVFEAWNNSSVTAEMQTMTCGGVHNFGIRRQELLDFRGTMVEVAKDARLHPCNRSDLLTGDFNIPPDFVETFNLSIPDRIKVRDGASQLPKVSNRKPSVKFGNPFLLC